MHDDDAGGDLTAPPFVIQCAPPFLVARLSSPHRTLGWSLLHPGFATIRDVVWVEVRNHDLGPGVDPSALLRAKLIEAGFPGALAFMTSRDVTRWRFAEAQVEGVEAVCLTTVGLSNGERIGSRRHARGSTGTINTLVRISRPLADGALVEAISIVAEARTAAIVESRPPQDGPAITGTGTDCIVVASPYGAEPERWAGLHTAVGEAIGAAVYRATRAGAEEWDVENARVSLQQSAVGSGAESGSCGGDRRSHRVQSIGQRGRTGLQDQRRLDFNDPA
jgi:adenosylcobinamide amidohydrolase